MLHACMGMRFDAGRRAHASVSMAPIVFQIGLYLTGRCIEDSGDNQESGSARRIYLIVTAEITGRRYSVGSALADAVLLSGVPENASAKADPTK